MFKAKRATYIYVQNINTLREGCVNRVMMCRWSYSKVLGMCFSTAHRGRIDKECAELYDTYDKSKKSHVTQMWYYVISVRDSDVW